METDDMETHQSENFEFDVFISHASEDTAWCEQLAERLKGAGLEVWFDQWQLSDGGSLPGMIEKGLAASKHIVLVMTPAYFVKEWTMAEAYFAVTKDPTGQRRFAIPILREKCTRSPLLQSWIYLDFRNDDQFFDNCDQLVTRLRSEPLLESQFPSFAKLQNEIEIFKLLTSRQLSDQSRGLKLAHQRGEPYAIYLTVRVMEDSLGSEHSESIILIEGLLKHWSRFTEYTWLRRLLEKVESLHPEENQTKLLDRIYAACPSEKRRQIADQIQFIAKEAKYSSAKERLGAILAMGFFASDFEQKLFYQELVKIFQDLNEPWEARRYAALALGKIRNRGAIRIFTRKFEELNFPEPQDAELGNEDFQKAIFNAGQEISKAATGFLKAVAQASFANTYLRQQAMGELANFAKKRNDPGLVDFFKAFLKHENCFNCPICSCAVEKLGEIGQDAVNELLDIVEDSNKDIILRRDAAQALGAIRNLSAMPSAIPRLNQMLKIVKLERDQILESFEMKEAETELIELKKQGREDTKDGIALKERIKALKEKAKPWEEFDKAIQNAIP